ncbi:uncharacterized protein LOC122511850 [Leptopilina heterotoma]|uniref:uncharacterized protein LOC122511850 n=1 Tax=Leptopilina heterotoma TaxID=63436 RepID=UPI001CA8F367|nr:uncharacterized protein LOC122511850 [Leptopilina heterotoma]
MKLLILFTLLIATLIFEVSQKNYITKSEIIENKRQNQSEWSQEVIMTLINDPKLYQIMLLSNNAKKYIRFVQDLRQHLPTLYFNEVYLKREIQNLQKRTSLSHPRDTTLFILVEFPNKNNTQWTEEMMAFIKQLSTVRIRPKCLIVRFLDSQQTSNYTTFLTKMWNDYFLDLTILDVVKGRTTIHRLNPFISYRRKVFSRKTLLFPQKLRNLNGYPLKVAYITRPPYATLKRNSTNHPFNIIGPDSVVGHTFAEMMNYNQVLVPSKNEEFGNFSCNVNKITGFDSLVQKRIVHFISVTTTLVRTLCKKEVIENAIFALDHYVAVAPILKSGDYTVTIGETFFYSIALTLLITVIGWITMIIFKFDALIWNWTVIIQVLFGVAVNLQPTKIKEQVFCAILFLVNFYYSFHILESLTDFNFRMDKEKELNNIDDLMKSGLQFGSEVNTRNIMPGVFGQDNFTAWVKRGRLLALEECIEFLVEFKNVTCIMKLAHAEWFAGFYKENNLVKFIPEYFGSVGIGFFLEPGSPYVEKFEQIHRSLKEVGILEKWKISKKPNATRILQLGIATQDKFHNSDDSVDDWKIQSLLFGIMIAGYFASALSFLLELVLGKREKRRRLQTV